MSKDLDQRLVDVFRGVSRKTIKWSNYFAVYEKIFAQYVGQPITFVEVGVFNGGSLQMWRRYLGNKARIIGVDLNPAARAMEREDFEIHIGDQADPAFWRSFYTTVGDIDVLLDDGGHTNLQQIVTMVEAVPRVRDGGIIVTEDTHTSYIRREFLNPSRYSFMNFAYHVVDLVNSRNPRTEHHPLDQRGLANSVYSVEFFDSIVIFHVDRRLIGRPSLLSYGDDVFTSDDFRHASSLTARWSALRSAYRRLPRWIRTATEPARRVASYAFERARSAGVARDNRRAAQYFR